MEQSFHQLCPKCRQPMALVRTVPKLGLFLPELEVFRCRGCGEVETRERQPAKAAAPYQAGLTADSAIRNDHIA
jgi:hypothetical protein